MSNLHLIAQRHRPDRWSDMIFLAGAVLLVALSLGSVTSRAAGSVAPRQWTVTVLESNLEVLR
ncbi:MAG: hypothetical protein H7138_15055 [Myxococcales bacterium]|nr:hypothetical protein [Myxococcales bacterium]